MKGFIYKYTFPDGKVYIGQTVRPVAARHREHTTPSTGKLNSGFWEAWELYGDANLEVLETVEESNSFALSDKLNALEIYHIENYQATDPRYGYNRVSGGYGTSASKKVLQKAFRKEFNKLWEDRAIFYSNLEEIIHRAAYDPVDLDQDQFIFLRDCALPEVDTEYSKYIKLTTNGQLSFYCESKEHVEFFLDEALSWLLFTVYDLSKVEASELARDVESYVLSNSTSILSEGIIQKVDKNGIIVKEYGSINEVMHDLNLSYTTNIYNVLEGKQKTAYGYIWRWKKDSPKD